MAHQEVTTTDYRPRTGRSFRGIEKMLLAIVVLVFAACDGNTEPKAEPKTELKTELMASIVTEQETIESGWRKTTIKVEKGGEHPTVMQLLKAFNTVWSIDAADSIIAAAGDEDFFVEDWYENNGPVFVDNIDYCCAKYNRVDSEQNLEARTYLRENGHTLFAVLIGQGVPEQRAFACFYDYDPKTQMLTPEDEPYKNMEREWEQSTLSYFLGEKFDQTVIVQEKLDDGSVWYHHYGWNGMKHEFHHVGEDCYAPEDNGDEEDDQQMVSAPEEDWTEEAVAAQVRKYFDAVNKTFVDLDLDLNPSDLDKLFYTNYWNEVYEAVHEKDLKQQLAENMFFIDDNHWTAGLEPPLTVENIKVELLTGSMAEAAFTLVEKESGSRKKAILSLDYQRGQWCINNWLEKSNDVAGSILVQMEKYIY